MLVGGETEMKPSVSGRRIRSCMPTQAPKSKPATQHCEAAGWVDCSQSSAVAASASSPIPESNSPWLRPTPRELKRRTLKPRFMNRWKRHGHGMVHVPARPGVRVQDQGDRGGVFLAGGVTGFEAPGAAG